jgi:hypothetical protein
MDVASLTRTASPNPFAAVSGSAASPGVRQALALIGGAADTVRTVRREAQSVERRAPQPFADQVDIKPRSSAETAGKTEAASPARPATQASPESGDLDLPGSPETVRTDSGPAAAGRGALVDIQA